MKALMHRFRMLTHQEQIQVLLQITAIAMVCIIIVGILL